MKSALVFGAGGFIGSHLVRRLKNEGFWVRGVDLKKPSFSETSADDFIVGDLRDMHVVSRAMLGPFQKSEKDYDGSFDEVYQLAADMGGAGYIFTGTHDADIMHNSCQINLNVCTEAVKKSIKRIFYSSSACMYPEHNQLDPNNPKCDEASAYPAAPDSEYGWEKLFSERVYLAFAKNYGLRVRIARFHNIFGPLGAWNNGKEKAPAALCRKVATNSTEVEVWGPGTQTRSFLYIDECIQGIHKIMDSNCDLPLNLGSERMISINELVYLIADRVGKKISIKNISGPLGVMGRNSHNKLINEKIGWKPSEDLEYGIDQTYAWIKQQLDKGIEDTK